MSINPYYSYDNLKSLRNYQTNLFRISAMFDRLHKAASPWSAGRVANGPDVLYTGRVVMASKANMLTGNTDLRCLISYGKEGATKSSVYECSVVIGELSPSIMEDTVVQSAEHTVTQCARAALGDLVSEDKDDSVFCEIALMVDHDCRFLMADAYSELLCNGDYQEIKAHSYGAIADRLCEAIISENKVLQRFAISILGETVEFPWLFNKYCDIHDGKANNPFKLNSQNREPYYQAYSEWKATVEFISKGTF